VLIGEAFEILWERHPKCFAQAVEVDYGICELFRMSCLDHRRDFRAEPLVERSVGQLGPHLLLDGFGSQLVGGSIRGSADGTKVLRNVRLSAVQRHRRRRALSGGPRRSPQRSQSIGKLQEPVILVTCNVR
jgi:hypothetical protein